MLLALVASSVLAAAAPEPALDLRPRTAISPARTWEDDSRGAAESFRPGVAGASGVALVVADAAVFLGGVALLGATKPPGGCEYFCVDPTAFAVALLGLALVPPAVATHVADQVEPAPGGARAVLAYAVQGAAIGLVVGAARARSDALLASALAVHFVGIPLALGFAPAAGARGGGAPTLSYAVKF
jgi:hypothetical protein